MLFAAAIARILDKVLSNNNILKDTSQLSREHSTLVQDIRGMTLVGYCTEQRLRTKCWGPKGATTSNVLEKEAPVLLLRIGLEHKVFELKLTRILFRVDHGYPVFERLKMKENEKKKKKLENEKWKTKKSQTSTTQELTAQLPYPKMIA